MGDEGMVPGITRPGRAAGRVLLIGALSGALYLVVHAAQRGIYLNGLAAPIGEAADRGRLLAQCGAYYGATAALFGLYAWLLNLCRRGALTGRRARALALAIPLLFNLAFLPTRPYLSTDLFSYAAYGYMGATPGDNPYLHAGRDVEATPFGRALLERAGRSVSPTRPPYGPLWLHLASLVLRATRDVAVALAALKVLVVAASLASAALVWAILGRVRPGQQLLGTLLYLWNPVVIVEVAGEGHNDSLMIALTLAALLATLRGRPGLGSAGLLLGTLAKYVPLILLPALLVHGWRTLPRRRLALEVALGGLAAVALAALLFWPFWAGAETFRGLREQGAATLLPSTSAIAFWALDRILPEALAGGLARAGLSLAFGLVALPLSLRARDPDSLLRACAGVALAYVLIASPVYWPWYALLPLALMALSPRGPLGPLALALALGSRLGAPLDAMAVNGHLRWPLDPLLPTATMVVLPLGCALLLAWRCRRAPGPGAG